MPDAPFPTGHDARADRWQIGSRWFVVVGPPLFTLLSSATGSYRLGFASFGVASIIAALALLVRAGGREPRCRSEDSRVRDRASASKDAR